MLGRALQGFTVLDCSQGIAGPHAGCLLAQMGARVLKIEPPSGDWLRNLGVRAGDTSVLFETFNRGKLGVVLDLKSTDGREALLRLVPKADVFVESNRPGVMKRLGLDYDSVKAHNPRIVYLSMTGFGQFGPAAQRPATDAAVQAFSGISYGAGDMKTPVRVRLSLVDIVSGLYASHAVLGALLGRSRTGEGTYLDLSLLHAAVSMQAYKFAEHALTGGKLQAELFAGIGIYQTSDGYLAISAMREDQVVVLLRIVGRAELLEDPRFATPEARFAHQAELRDALSMALQLRPAREWVPKIQAADLICEEVQTYDAVRGHPQAIACQLFQDADFGAAGRLPAVRMPGLASGEFRATRAPRIGEHTRQILAEASHG